MADLGIERTTNVELALPAHFEQAATMIDKATVAKTVICGPDPERHLDGIKKYAQAGYDHVFVHQIGPDQEGFFKFFKSELMPLLEKEELVQETI